MRFLTVALAAALSVSAYTASAVTISVTPTASMVDQGDSVTVELVISDLGAFAPPSLGAFNLAVDFDDSLVSFDSVFYFPFLGTVGVDTAVVTTPGVGTVELDNTSFLSDTDLDALQNSAFQLARLTFTGLAVGVSALDLTLLDISTAVGDDITSTTLVQNGTLEVKLVAPVPTPGTYLLMLPALLAGVATMRRRS